nr:DUF5984 family protein [uncultured Flavobacterium sp.]
MINFKLKNIDKIIPVGQEPNQTLSWFWLTDGELWLNFENETIYKYSDEAIHYFGNESTSYNDYYLIRFIEDFIELFEKMSESIPENFYLLAEDLKKFKSKSQDWLDIHDTNENTDFYFDEYYKLVSWINERTLDSGHLIGGPNLYFFRKNDKIKIIWETEYSLENGISLWTATDGCSEMNYHDFVSKIKMFGEDFFNKMDDQIELALSRNFKNIFIDKNRLVEEHQERKEDFWNAFKLLTKESDVKTDWTHIDQIYNSIIKD